jgi:YD repeat protein
LWNQGKKLYQAATNSAKDLWNKATTIVKIGWDKTKKWFGENWEYLAGAGLVALGIGISALSVAGGPLTMVVFGALGGAISSAGTSMFTQKAQKGSVDTGEMLKDAAIGAVVGGITGGIGGRIIAGAKQAAGVVTKPNWITGPVARSTDWKWANNLIRKPVDFKPLAGLKGTSGVADDVAMMAPAREAKEFMSKQVARLMAPGEHTMFVSRGWWHNLAVSQVTTMQPIKFAVNYAVGGLVAGASSVATSTMHTAEDVWRNIHKK